MLSTTRRLAAALPFAALLFASPLTHAAEPIYTPEPIVVPAGKSQEAVRQAIRKALFSKNFEIKEVGGGHIEGKYTKSGRKGARHVAVITVRYDAKAVKISYKDSEDLDYDAKDGTIHKTYNRWVRNVEKSIRASLGSY
ncbi:MAG TPA: hypothetical protein VGA00_01780 [Acidiferrobacterales bacterium]|jgi:hypothetical protein